MASFERFNKELDDLQRQGCSSESLDSFREQYKQKADEAEQRLREKQAIEREQQKFKS